MAELVVKRYATALFEAAKEENALAKYSEEVGVILEAFKETPDFMAVLDNHKVVLEEKIALTQKVFDGRIEDSILGLIVLMLKKGRQSSIVEVFENFLGMIKDEQGILKASVTSAVALTSVQVAQIKAKLEASTKSEIELETIIDETIIAGLIIRVGDKVIDASIKGGIDTLKKQLSELRLA